MLTRMIPRILPQTTSVYHNPYNQPIRARTISYSEMKPDVKSFEKVQDVIRILKERTPRDKQCMWRVSPFDEFDDIDSPIYQKHPADLFTVENEKEKKIMVYYLTNRIKSLRPYSTGDRIAVYTGTGFLMFFSILGFVGPIITPLTLVSCLMSGIVSVEAGKVEQIENSIRFIMDLD